MTVHHLPGRRQRRLSLAGTVLLIALIALSTTAVALATVPSASRTAFRVAFCAPKTVGSITTLCGPATAHLSVFPGVTFRGGSCDHRPVLGRPSLSLELGVLVNSTRPGNGGRRYLQLLLSGSSAHPTSGHLIAYSGSKRWSGYGVSFTGTALGGTFVLRATAPNTGTATGSFHC